MKVICYTCKDKFYKATREVNRAARLGRKHFCSRSCSAAHGNKMFNRGNVSRLSADNRLDEYSPFRAHFALAKRHAKEKGREFTLSLKDLKNQWDSQKGACPYTGWNLENPRTSATFHRATRSPRRASLDRISSEIGYKPDNIQFVSMMANLAKNNFSELQLVEFCKAVAAKQVL